MKHNDEQEAKEHHLKLRISQEVSMMMKEQSKVDAINVAVGGSRRFFKATATRCIEWKNTTI